MRRIFVAALAVVVPGALFPVPAKAQERALVVAVVSWTYSPTPVHVVRGQGLTFANLDGLSGEGHSLTEVAARGTGRFTSPIIPIGSSAPVAGVERLLAGSYRFTCRVHPMMTGTLVVE